MNIHEALKFLYDLQFFGIKMGLENIWQLCEELEHPQKNYMTIHVAGTNGKGTVCACLDSIFRECGYRTGLYTSPHIYHFSERIRVNGQSIDEDTIIRYTLRLKPMVEKLRATFFEATTAMAFQYFSDLQVDCAVIETGLGGRLDATNILLPEMAVITSIDLDHTEYLGHTKPEIAREKGGIIKAGIPVIIGDPDKEVKEVLRDIAKQQQAPVLELDEAARVEHIRMDERGSSFDLQVRLPERCRQWENLRIPFIGEHQIRNAAMAVTAAISQNRMGLDDEGIRSGLLRAYIPGRLEWLDRNTVMDAAHNPASLKALTQVIGNIFTKRFRRIYMIIGMLADKNIEESATILKGYAEKFYCITPDSPRALKAEELSDKLIIVGLPAQACASMEEALNEARKKMTRDDLLIITGSHYVLSLVPRIH